jgi:hypothetical protein
MTAWLDAAKRLPLAGSVAGFWGELRTSRRAVFGLLLIAALVAGYGLLALHDATLASGIAYRRELTNLGRMKAIATERDWPARAEASGEARAAFEARLWPAESEGVARADLQAWIGTVGREIGLQNLDIRIELAKPKELPDDLRQITATITGRPDETALTRLLERIDRAPRLIVVDRLNVKEQPAPMLEMVLVGYARIGGSRRAAP